MSEEYIVFNEKKHKLMINRIPHEIITVATHTETLQKYIIVKSISLVKAVETNDTILQKIYMNEINPRPHFYCRNIYQHYKNKKFYRMLLEALDMNTGEEFVLYEALYDDHKLWLRPKDMFFSKVTTSEGGMVDRFSLIKDFSILKDIESSRF